MIIELFGAPGSGKTFLIDQFLEHSPNDRKFLTREDFGTWVRNRGRLFKLRCLFHKLPLSIYYSVLLLLLRVAVQKPNVEISWIPKAVLNEVMLREFLKLNPGSVVLLDQGSVQRIVCYILFSSLYRPVFVQFILRLMFSLLSKCKIHVCIYVDVSVSTNRVINRTKDPSISRFDSLDCKDSLHEKISEATQFFSSLALAADYKTSEVYTFDNTEEKRVKSNSFYKLISTILK